MKYPQLILFLVPCLFTGCSSFNKDEFKVKKITGNPSFYVPVAFGNLTLQGILKKMKDNDVTVHADPNGLLYLHYVQSKKSAPASTFIRLEDYEVVRSTEPFVGTTLPANSTERVIHEATISTAFNNLAPKRLTEIKFKNTTLAIMLNDPEFDTGPSGIEVEIKIPNLKKDGVAFTHRQSIGPVTRAFSLNDYVMTLGDNHAFTFEITIIEKAHTEPVTYPRITIATRLRFASIEFSYLKGYLGDHTILIPNMKYELGASSPKLKEGEYTVKNPTFEVDLYNGFGAPMDFTFKPLEVETRAKNKIPVQTDQPNPVPLPQPSGLDQRNSITLVKATNSQEAFGKRPKFLFLHSFANLNRNKSPGENFCSDTSTVGWRFRLKYPLNGNAEKSYIRDTVAVNISDVKVEDVQEAALTVNVNNQMPAEILIQVYLSDSKGENYEKLLTANNMLVKSSEVNSKGEFTAAGIADKEIPIDKEVLKKLTEIKKIIFEAEFATGHQPQDVKFMADQIIKVQLGLKITLKATYVSKK